MLLINSINLVERSFLIHIAQERTDKAVSREHNDFGHGKVKRVCNRYVIIIHITAEIGRVIRVHGDPHP